MDNCPALRAVGYVNFLRKLMFVGLAHYPCINNSLLIFTRETFNIYFVTIHLQGNTAFSISLNPNLNSFCYLFDSWESLKPTGYEVFDVEPYDAGTDSQVLLVRPEDLQKAAFTLSYKPLSINHGMEKYPGARWLDYPANQTLEMTYDSKIEGIRGQIALRDSRAWQAVHYGDFQKLSVDFHSFGESEGRGMVFWSLALLTREVTPADKEARILHFRPSYLGVVKHDLGRLPEIAKTSLVEHLQRATAAHRRRP